MISLPIQGYAATALAAVKAEGWGEDPSLAAVLDAWRDGVLVFTEEQRPQVIAGLLALASMQDEFAVQEGRRDPSGASAAYAASRGFTSAAARAEAL